MIGHPFSSSRVWIGGAAVATILLGAGFAAGLAAAQLPAKATFVPLFATSKTILDEPIAYPAGTAEVTADIVAIGPGDSTSWHTHNVPAVGFILEGEVTVDYGEKGTHTYKQGEAFVETLAVPHQGSNRTDKPVRLFVLYMGAKGLPLTSPASPPPRQ